MAERVTWNERLVDGIATVDFDGPAMSLSVLWAGLVATLCAAFFAYLIWYAPNRSPLIKLGWVRALPVPLLVVGAALTWRGIPAAHSGRILVDARRFRVLPQPGYAPDIDVELSQIDYFAGSGDDHAIDSAKAAQSREWDRFRVYMYLRDGRRLRLATFCEPDPALFMAQRLDALIERIRYRATASSSRT